MTSGELLLRYFNGEKLADLLEEVVQEAYEHGYDDAVHDESGCC